MSEHNGPMMIIVANTMGQGAWLIANRIANTPAHMPPLNEYVNPMMIIVANTMGQGAWLMMIILLLFLQKQNLAFAVYLLGSVLSSPD
jgi:hypothetical protein